jgi:hypothetical protein
LEKSLRLGSNWNYWRTIDLLLKDIVVNNTIMQSDSPEIFFDTNSNKKNISTYFAEYYFYKRLILVFMNTITRFLNNYFTVGGTSRLGKEIIEFCEIFDHEILGFPMKRGLGIRRIFDYAMEFSSNRLERRFYKDILMNSKEFDLNFRRLGRKTMKVLDKIFSSKGDYL